VPEGAGRQFIEVGLFDGLLGHIDQENRTSVSYEQISARKSLVKAKKNRNLKPNPVLPMF
jgi:hypothetical protein